MTPIGELNAAATKVRADPGLVLPGASPALAVWLDDHANDHCTYKCYWDEDDCPALQLARLILQAEPARTISKETP